MRPPPIMLAIAVTTLAACATPYQAGGLMGGFSETYLAPDIVRINFRGNAYTSGEKAQDYVLLRAAEVMLGNGLPYFVVLDESNSSTAHASTTQGTANTYGTINTSGNMATYQAQTTYNPGQTRITYKPESGLLVKGFAARPEGNAAFDARFIEQSIRSKYRIE